MWNKLLWLLVVAVLCRAATVQVRQWHHDDHFDFQDSYPTTQRHCGDVSFIGKCDKLMSAAVHFLNEQERALIDLDYQRGMAQDIASFTCFCTVTLLYSYE